MSICYSVSTETTSTARNARGCIVTVMFPHSVCGDPVTKDSTDQGLSSVAPGTEQQPDGSGISVPPAPEPVWPVGGAESCSESQDCPSEGPRCGSGGGPTRVSKVVSDPSSDGGSEARGRKNDGEGLGK